LLPPHLKVNFFEATTSLTPGEATVNNWADIPARIRTYAIQWREGTPIRNQCNSDATYYRVMKQLREHGLDCSKPCNVMTLVQRIEVVKVQPLPSRRAA